MPVCRHLDFPRSERGAALIEYGLLLGLIAVGAIAAVSSLGREIDTTFTHTSDALHASVLASDQELTPENPFVAYMRPTNTECHEFEGSYSPTPQTLRRECVIATRENPGYDMLSAYNHEVGLFLQVIGYYDRIYSGTFDDTLVVQPFIEPGRQYNVGNYGGKDTLVIPDWHSKDVEFEYLSESLIVRNKDNASYYRIFKQMRWALKQTHQTFEPFTTIRFKDREMNGDEVKAKLFEDDPSTNPQMLPYPMSPYED